MPEMLLLVMVLDDSTKLGEVLRAWRDAGIRGVTVIDSTGINRVVPRTEALAAMTRFGAVFGSGRVGHNTLFAVVESMDVVEEAAKRTQGIVGDLRQPNTGIMFTLPIGKTWGVPEGESADWGES